MGNKKHNKVAWRRDGVVALQANKKATILIDESMENELRKHTWSVDVRGYAMTWVVTDGKRRNVKMHRMVAELSVFENMDCLDHANGDKLDNRASNIRPCTTSQNLANQKVRQTKLSKYKGVAGFTLWNNSKTKAYHYWTAKIAHGGKRLYLGSFKDEESAAAAYDEAAVRLFGEFARTNF